MSDLVRRRVLDTEVRQHVLAGDGVPVADALAGAALHYTLLLPLLSPLHVEGVRAAPVLPLGLGAVLTAELPAARTELHVEEVVAPPARSQLIHVVAFDL